MKNLKYIALGILVSYLGCYIYKLAQKPNITFRPTYYGSKYNTSVETDDEEEKDKKDQ